MGPDGVSGDGDFGTAVARTYDADDAGRFAPEVLGPTVDVLVELAGGGRALEFAVGTGRVALALADRGVQVLVHCATFMSAPVVLQMIQRNASSGAKGPRQRRQPTFKPSQLPRCYGPRARGRGSVSSA